VVRFHPSLPTPQVTNNQRHTEKIAGTFRR